MVSPLQYFSKHFFLLLRNSTPLSIIFADVQRPNTVEMVWISFFMWKMIFSHRCCHFFVYKKNSSDAKWLVRQKCCMLVTTDCWSILFNIHVTDALFPFGQQLTSTSTHLLGGVVLKMFTTNNTQWMNYTKMVLRDGMTNTIHQFTWRGKKWWQNVFTYFFRIFANDFKIRFSVLFQSNRCAALSKH